MVCKIKEHDIMYDKLDVLCNNLESIKYKGNYSKGITILYNLLREHNILLTINGIHSPISFIPFGTIKIKDDKVEIKIGYCTGISWAYIFVNGIDVTRINGNWYTYINNKLLPDILQIVQSMLDKEEAWKNKKIKECNDIFTDTNTEEIVPEKSSFLTKIKNLWGGK